jgi:chromosome segregation ATPase
MVKKRRRDTMKFKEVEYSRLFNLSNYNNERIGFKVSLDDTDDPVKVVNKLYDLVDVIENNLEAHRKAKEKIEYLKDAIRRLNKEIQSAELRKDELIRELEKFADNECRVQNIQNTIDYTIELIKDYEKMKDETNRALNLWNKMLEEIEQKLRDGSTDPIVLYDDIEEYSLDSLELEGRL